MTCCSAAVGPTSDSALPIRAKLDGDPDIVGTWVARLIAAPLNQRATKASALPIRAELSGGPDIVGRKGEMTCSYAAVGPTSDSALPIRAKLFGGPEREDGDIISCQ